MKKKAFVVIYPDMKLGGIQKNIWNYLRVFQEEKIDTYWIATSHPIIDGGFLPVINQTTILSLDKKVVQDKLKQYEYIAAVSFAPLDMENLKILMHGITSVRYFLIIPHFKNPEIFLEEFFLTSKKKKTYYEHVKALYQQYMLKNQLYFFASKQGIALCEHYNLDKSYINAHLCPAIQLTPSLNEQILFSKAARDKEFNIITVARFEFPHKGYILGLIDQFPDIKRKIPSATLTIIGYGNGEKDVEQHIFALPMEIRNSITCVGKVSYTDLGKYYNKAHVSVSLAGSVADSAVFGVPPIVARHYTNQCEVYGYYCDVFEKTISEDEGQNIVSYLMQAYKMSDEDYYNLCFKNHERISMIRRKKFDSQWLFKMESQGVEPQSNKYVLHIRNQMKRWLLKYRAKMLFTDPKTYLKKAKLKINAIVKPLNISNK